MRKTKLLLAGAILMTGAVSCQDDPEPIVSSEYEHVDAEPADNNGPVKGFYVLNEGNMGANKATIDYFTYQGSNYLRNIYAERNPTVVKELGDVGNDIATYKNRLYIVVNGSNKVEVLDAATTVRIGQVDIANCRNIAFDGNSAYVSSFVGGTGENGSVVRFDINSLEITGTASVGLQPEEIVIADGYLYVANSGQFQAPNYDKTISVVNLSTFQQESSITVDVNLHHLRKDAEGNLWVSSRGNYYDIPSNLYKHTREGANKYSAPKALNVPCTNLVISGTKLYYYATVYDANWNATQQYGIVNTSTATVEPGSFITDGTETSIMAPYALAVQPYNGDIFITDARNYVSSGQVRCYTAEGKLKWTVTAGDIPGHIAFVE